MALDSDLIRVDLLRLKRKIFLSFPKGSQAQKDFVIASKMSELGYLSKLVPEEFANKILLEHKEFIKSEYTALTFSFLLGCGFSILLLGLSKLFHNHTLFYLCLSPILIGILETARHIGHILDEYKNVKPFKREYAGIQERINKLKKEIQNGFKNS